MSSSESHSSNLITHHIATESVVWKGMTIFLGLCCVFALLVGFMSFGRYGYAPSIEFFWAPISLLLLWKTNVLMGKVDANQWRYQIRLFGYPLTTKHFSNIYWEANGKICSLNGTLEGKPYKTAIFVQNNSEHKAWIDKIIEQELTREESSMRLCEDDYWFVAPQVVMNEWGQWETLLNIKCKVEGNIVETLHFTEDCIESKELELIIERNGRLAFDEIDRNNTLYFVKQIGLNPEDSLDLSAALKFGIYGNLWNDELKTQKLICFTEMQRKEFPQKVKIVTDAGGGIGIALKELGGGELLVITLEDIDYIDTWECDDDFLPRSRLYSINKNRLIAIE
jgi:hypothetical protein